jgi:streptogramin lyase
MRYTRLSQPCRNFNILGIARIADPRDGREKVVLSNFASGMTGALVLVDPATGEGETLPLPGDNGAWAVLSDRDERLYIGTCPESGTLHALDLRTRAWAPPLRDPGELYIWNLVFGSDGLVYGGTWPGCALLRYDPARHALDNLGRVSDNPDNCYSRTVHSLPGRLLIACGYAEPHLALWDLAAGRVSRFGPPGAQVREVNSRFFCLEAGGGPQFYDSRTCERLDQDLSAEMAPAYQPRMPGGGFHTALSDGRVFVVRGQEYCLEDPRQPGELRLAPIPADRPPTAILTLTVDADNRVWGSSAFGQTIFCCDPATGEAWNSQMVCDRGGEVYGMAFAGGKLFMSSYAGGDHIVYDPSQPWSQLDNRNPRTLEPAGPALIRPSARSVAGPDGAVWTGWMARYGAYGGGLSRIDPGTLAVSIWPDPVPGQAVGGLAADDRYLYAITTGGANGLPEQRAPLHFFVWSPDGGLAWRRRFDEGRALRAVCAVGGRALVAVDQAIEVFDPRELRFVGAIALPQPCRLLAAWRGAALAACGDALWRVDPAAGSAARLCDLPAGAGQLHAIAQAPDGSAYFACGSHLYRLEEEG